MERTSVLKVDKKHISRTSVPASSSTNICWICHQETSSAGNKDSPSQRFFNTSSSSFRPCHCKGSLGNVHKECLNQLASEQYRLALKQNDKDDLPIINCPNCKAPYEYTVFEMKKFRGLRSIKLVSMESFWLLFLIVAQLTVLIYDIFFLSNTNKSAEESKEPANEGAKYMELSQYLHVFTVLVVITAAAFTLFEAVQKEIKVEVHSQY